jgi:hypothetical protein
MRIVDEVSRDMSLFALGTGAGAEAHTSIYSGAAYGRGPADAESEGKCGSPESKYESDASRLPVATALSWLVARLIEGFAAYGQGMHPSFVDLGECIDGRKLEWDSQRRPQTQDEHRSEMPWLNLSHPRTSRDADRSSRAPAASPGSHARHTSPGLPLLGKDTPRTESKADDDEAGGARRPNLEGYRHSSARRSLDSRPPMSAR